jgi:hypothetical protein
MIAFDLQCANDHVFEGWFEDGQAYEEQKAKGLITCPICDDICVSKIPSTFAIKSSLRSERPIKSQHNLEKIGKQIIDYVEKNFDDVGSDFSAEALKIHYGAAEPRNIRGVSTKEEEKTLKKEGVQFFKIPMPAATESDS